MHILEAWYDSAKLLKPENLKLFMLVTLKSILDLYTLFISRFLVLFLPVVLGLFALALVIPEVSILYVIIYSGLFIFSTYVTLLLIRPSIARKNISYIIEYVPYSIWLIVLYILGLFLNNFLATGTCCIFGIMGMALYSICAIFTLLFILDSDKKCISAGRSFVRALQMMVYNVPLLIAAIILCSVIIRFLVCPYKLVIISGPLIVPIMLCLVTNIYIKKLHDQFVVYFPEKRR